MKARLLRTGKDLFDLSPEDWAILRGGELALVYKGHALPLVWKSDGTADFVISAFGVKMPLSARFDSKDGRIDSFSIPFAMDPRVKAEVFVRRAVEEPIEVSGTGG